MMLGGSPSQLVWIMTWTSEMSGRASSGIRFIDQMPSITSRNVPVNTRKRLCAHQSMIQPITLHASCRVHSDLLVGDRGSMLARGNRYLPGSAGTQIPFAFVKSVTLVRQIDGSFHGGHSHCGHGSHV